MYFPIVQYIFYIPHNQLLLPVKPGNPKKQTPFKNRDALITVQEQMLHIYSLVIISIVYKYTLSGFYKSYSPHTQQIKFRQSFVSHPT